MPSFSLSAACASRLAKMAVSGMLSMRPASWGGDAERQVRAIGEIRLVYLARVRILAPVYGEQRENPARPRQRDLHLHAHGEDRTVGLDELQDLILRSVSGGHFYLRVSNGTGAARGRIGVAGAATGGVEARTQSCAGFQISGDRVHFLKRGADILEILCVDAGYGGACVGPTLAHARVGGPRRLIGVQDYAACRAEDSWNYGELHRNPDP